MPVLWDVEHVDSVKRFVEGLNDKINQYTSVKSRGGRLVKKAHQLLGGAKAWGFEMPKVGEVNYHDLLAKLLNELSDYQLSNHVQMLLIWDEFPWMLQKIIKYEGAKAAADLLDTLRHCRQSNKNLRMLYTGSIGLHQVINTIRATGFSNEPTNDMRTMHLDALSHDDAIVLTKALLAGAGVSERINTEPDIQSLCELVDNVPYYIHHIVSSLKTSKDTPEQIVQGAIAGHNNSWELEHYYDRLSDYYPHNWQDYALLLDEIAFSDQPLRRSEVEKQLQANEQVQNQQAIKDKALLKKMLHDLTADHYLVQDVNTAAYQFRYPLIKKWWCFYRD